MKMLQIIRLSEALKAEKKFFRVLNSDENDGKSKY